MFVDDPLAALHPGECPHAVGSAEWKQWQREFAENSRVRDLIANGGRAAAQQTARLDALKERLPKRTDAQRRHDELMAEVEEATRPGPSIAEKAIIEMMNHIAASMIIIDDQPVPGVRSVNLFANTYPDMRAANPEPDVKMIRGKPAGKVKNQTCPKHGQPQGSCRRCWR